MKKLFFILSIVVSVQSAFSMEADREQNCRGRVQQLMQQDARQISNTQEEWSFNYAYAGRATMGKVEEHDAFCWEFDNRLNLELKDFIKEDEL